MVHRAEHHHQQHRQEQRQRESAITLKNNAATTIRIATNTTNDTFRDMPDLLVRLHSTRAYSSKLAPDVEYPY